MLTIIGAALILIGGFITCTALAIETDSKKTPEERLQDTIDENARCLKSLEYEILECNRRSR